MSILLLGIQESVQILRAIEGRELYGEPTEASMDERQRLYIAEVPESEMRFFSEYRGQYHDETAYDWDDDYGDEWDDDFTYLDEINLDVDIPF